MLYISPDLNVNKLNYVALSKYKINILLHNKTIIKIVLIEYYV